MVASGVVASGVVAGGMDPSGIVAGGRGSGGRWLQPSEVCRRSPSSDEGGGRTSRRGGRDTAGGSGGRGRRGPSETVEPQDRRRGGNRHAGDERFRIGAGLAAGKDK